MAFSLFARRACIYISLLSLTLFVTTHVLAQSDSAFLKNLRRITTDGNSIAPQFSPSDSQLLAFTRQNYQGIYLIRSDSLGGLGAGATPTDELTQAADSGFAFSWTAEGTSIVTRVNKAGVREAGVISVTTGEYTPLSSTEASVPVVTNNAVFFTQANNVNRVDLTPLQSGSSRQLRALRATSTQMTVYEKDNQIYVANIAISPATATCWLPLVAPDGLKVVYECWEGIYAYEINRKINRFLDKGTSPKWSPDSEFIVYEQTTDGSHYFMVASDVLRIQYDGTGKTNLTPDVDAIVRRPALSADGKQLAIDINGDVYIADLATEAR